MCKGIFLSSCWYFQRPDASAIFFAKRSTVFCTESCSDSDSHFCTHFIAYAIAYACTDPCTNHDSHRDKRTVELCKGNRRLYLYRLSTGKREMLLRFY